MKESKETLEKANISILVAVGGGTVVHYIVASTRYWVDPLYDILALATQNTMGIVRM